MTAWAYYNEHDKYAAQWIRNLIKAGLVAPGEVDERSIEDVVPGDLRGFRQCHFFAGIAVWSYALRSAGWEDSRPVWTGSCPCQPFSAAGAGSGFDDQRHLWPAFFHLIEQCKPTAILGEQVASKDADPWIDLVQTDLEAVGYGVGAIAFPAASVGAENIRDRMYWCANTGQHHLNGEAKTANNARQKTNRPTDKPSMHIKMDDCARSVEWVKCNDGFSRPIEPGLCAVVDAYPGRVEQLCAYGNSLNAKAAQVFIECMMESEQS